MNVSAGITGLGQASELGCGVENLWHALCAPDARPPERGLAAAPAPEPSSAFLAVAEEALAMAGYADLVPWDRLGIVVGTFDVASWLAGDEPDCSWLEALARNAATPSLRAFLRGRRAFVSTACASGIDAVGLAASWIESGDLDVCLVIAGEAPSDATRSGMQLLKTVSPDGVVRPFDLMRNGTRVSAGHAALVLEGAAACARRPARVLASLLGYGSGTDVYNLVAPDPEGEALQRSMSAATSAGTDGEARAVDVVCAHASGTRVGDQVELQAIERVLGDRAAPPLITANKGLLGHTLGASGAFNLLQGALMLRYGTVPPVHNLEQPMPCDDLRLVRGAAVRREIAGVLCNSVGFGGQNSSMLLGPPPALA